MATIKLTNADTDHARAIWARYEREHDLSDQQGSTAGVDPDTERVWIGDSIEDVLEQMRSEGESKPLYFIRIGSDAYFRKGGHR